MNKRIWNLYAPIYEKAMRADRKVYEYMYTRIPQIIEGKEVLEIAAGPGLLAKRVSGAAKRMIATDYSPGMIAEAKKGEVPENLTFEVADAAALPCGNDSFDVVLIANALHVMPEPEKALSEIDRVLRPDGILIAPNFVNHKGTAAGRIWSGILRVAGISFEHQWSAGEYLDFLRRNGWRVTHSKEMQARIGIVYTECVRERQKGEKDTISLADAMDPAEGMNLAEKTGPAERTDPAEKMHFAEKTNPTGNGIFRMKTDGFCGELFCPAENRYPGKVLICFSGSDGKFALAKAIAAVFRSHGLTALALVYVMEEDLPDRFCHVPVDMLEAAAKRLHAMGYEKVGLWGLSKGAELALTAGSLLPGLVNAVVAVSPINLMCQGFSKEKGVTVLPGGTWSFHGAELPYASFGLAKFPTGQVIRKSIAARELTMYDLYLPLVEHPEPTAVIPVERITGPILLITSQMDTMWPSVPAAERIMERLRQKRFAYSYRHLSYKYGSHLFVPVETGFAQFFAGDRGKYRRLSKKARMDSLAKTLEFVSRW